MVAPGARTFKCQIGGTPPPLLPRYRPLQWRAAANSAAARFGRNLLGIRTNAGNPPK
jgi:hypothetical protein